MAAAFVQHIGDANATSVFGNSLAMTVSKTVTAGNTIVVGGAGMVGNGSKPTSCTDNLGNTYSLVESSTMSGLIGAGLLVAPITTGGTLTTITVTFDVNTDNRAVTAAEFSGVGALSVAGGATNGTSATPAWVVSKTIPANGLAVGVFGSFTDRPAATAGSASGSPSTSITRDTLRSGLPTVAILYAIAGGTAVTGFTGTAALGGSNEWAAAGGVYDAAIVAPVWTTPADTVSMSATPDLQFTSPTSGLAQHFQMQLDTVNTFNSGDLRTVDSSVSQTGWTYWNGSTWTALPSTGLPSGSSGAEIRYTVSPSLSSATWYRRVRAGS